MVVFIIFIFYRVRVSKKWLYFDFSTLLYNTRVCAYRLLYCKIEKFFICANFFEEKCKKSANCKVQVAKWRKNEKKMEKACGNEKKAVPLQCQMKKVLFNL